MEWVKSSINAATAFTELHPVLSVLILAAVFAGLTFLVLGLGIMGTIQAANRDARDTD